MCTTNQNLFSMIPVITNFRIIEVLVLVFYEFHIWQCESDDVSVVQPPWSVASTYRTNCFYGHGLVDRVFNRLSAGFNLQLNP